MSLYAIKQILTFPYGIKQILVLVEVYFNAFCNNPVLNM